MKQSCSLFELFSLTDIDTRHDIETLFITHWIPKYYINRSNTPMAPGSRLVTGFSSSGIYNVWLLLISNSVRTVSRNTVISNSLHTLWSEMSEEVAGFIHTVLEYQCLIHQSDGSFQKPQQLRGIQCVMNSISMSCRVSLSVRENNSNKLQLCFTACPRDHFRCDPCDASWHYKRFLHFFVFFYKAV